MPRYSHDITDLLSEEDVQAIFSEARSIQEQALVSILWIFGARPSEILELTSDKIKLIRKKSGDEVIQVVFATKKLHSDGRTFILKERQLTISRPIPPNMYAETLLEYHSRLRKGEPLFSYTRRWMEKVINKLSLKALGKKFSPYHFRHSAITREASHGRTVDQLKHFKGAKSIRSVEPYVHARPYIIDMDTEG